MTVKEILIRQIACNMISLSEASQRWSRLGRITPARARAELLK